MRGITIVMPLFFGDSYLFHHLFSFQSFEKSGTVTTQKEVTVTSSKTPEKVGTVIYFIRTILYVPNR